MTSNNGTYLLGISAGQDGSLGLLGPASALNEDYRNGFAVGSFERTSKLLTQMQKAQLMQVSILGEQLEKLTAVVNRGNQQIVARLDVIVDQLDEQARILRAENMLADADRYVSTSFDSPAGGYKGLSGNQLREQLEISRAVINVLRPAYEFVGRIADVAPAIQTLTRVENQSREQIAINARLVEDCWGPALDAMKRLGDALVGKGVPACVVPLVLDLGSAEAEVGARAYVRKVDGWPFSGKVPKKLTDHFDDLAKKQKASQITLQTLQAGVVAFYRKHWS